MRQRSVGLKLGKGYVRRLAMALLAHSLAVGGASLLPADDWLNWRGPGGNAVSEASPLPLRWSEQQNVRWRSEIPGEGVSSPIVVAGRVLLTSSFEQGGRRQLRCLDAAGGKLLWSREIIDDDPEISSALTGYASATLASDGRRVVAFFGNAGAVCHELDGRRLWRRQLGRFETELGLASSPVIHGDRVFLLCDHDGNRFDNFDSFLLSLQLSTGEVRWRTERRGVFRSWSTPLIVPVGSSRELVVCAEEQIRGYDADNGRLLWWSEGMSGWVAPSPVQANGLIYATSGKNGATLALRPGGRGDVTQSHVVWKRDHGGPYVCSPLFYRGYLYQHTSGGVLTCLDGRTGQVVYQQRLPGSYTSSPVAGDGKVYFTNESCRTLVVAPGPNYKLLADNRLNNEGCLASPALVSGSLLLRGKNRLYRIDIPARERAREEAEPRER